ncbi:MAG: ABC transporter ATP-binding protein YtrE [Gammaproteobacteria bacterium]|nr:ABC transporter ATP-binding protein YtrE [Gammaproteobacteria bacterium]
MFRLESISKTFSPGTPRQLTVLDNVNLEIEKGEFVILLGSNGAGKSTLLRIISGDIKPDSGRVLLNGVELTGLSPHERADYIYLINQLREKNLVSILTVLEAFALAMSRNKSFIHLINRRDWEKHVKTLLASLKQGLENHVNDQIWSLSGGEHQIITILIAAEMIRNSDRADSILLLDEHLAHLDPNSSKTVMALTSELVKQYALTTLMVTHHIQVASQYGDRVLVLKDGAIKYDVKNKNGEGKPLQHLSDIIS